MTSQGTSGKGRSTEARRTYPSPACHNFNGKNGLGRENDEMATISEVARSLGVDRDTVKHWTTEFAEHLSLAAKEKGKERQFNESDLRVLAFVAHFWEDDPDLENIHAMLNCGDYNDDPFAKFACLHTPIFQEVPDEINEDWRHGVLVGGIVSRDLPQVARTYKLATDELVKQALASYEPHELDYPILFLYRHTVELYLKAALTKPPEHHDLSRLIQLLEAECGNKLAGWIKDRLWDFHKMDHMSAIFRYADPPPDGELWIDFHRLQLVIDRTVEAFEQYIGEKHQAERAAV